MSPFKDQDHDSGRLDRMWQVTVLWAAALPAFVNRFQNLSAKSAPPALLARS